MKKSRKGVKKVMFGTKESARLGGLGKKGYRKQLDMTLVNKLL